MPGGVGAELATLADLKRSFDTNVPVAQEVVDATTPLPGHIKGITSSINTAVDAAVWEGANASKFRGAWEEAKPAVDALADALEEVLPFIRQLPTMLEDAAIDVKNNHNNLAEATGEADRI